MRHNRALVELRDYRPRRRDDWLVTLLIVTLFLGFILGIFVMGMIVDGQNGYQPTTPRQEKFYERRMDFRRL